MSPRDGSAIYIYILYYNLMRPSPRPPQSSICAHRDSRARASIIAAAATGIIYTYFCVFRVKNEQIFFYNIRPSLRGFSRVYTQRIFNI